MRRERWISKTRVEKSGKKRHGSFSKCRGRPSKKKEEAQEKRRNGRKNEKKKEGLSLLALNGKTQTAEGRTKTREEKK